MDTMIVRREGGKDFNSLGHEVVDCECCRERKTTALGTKRCDRCWELESRIEDDPKLAEQVLRNLDPTVLAGLSVTRLLDTQSHLNAAMGWPMGLGDAGVKENLLALVCEVHEALDETPWKPWKPAGYKRTDRDKLAEELVDCLKFLLNAMVAAGLTAQDVEHAFHSKTIENYRRVREGETRRDPKEVDSETDD